MASESISKLLREMESQTVDPMEPKFQPTTPAQTQESIKNIWRGWKDTEEAKEALGRTPDGRRVAEVVEDTFRPKSFEEEYGEEYPELCDQNRLNEIRQQKIAAAQPVKRRTQPIREVDLSDVVPSEDLKPFVREALLRTKSLLESLQTLYMQCK